MRSLVDNVKYEDKTNLRLSDEKNLRVPYSNGSVYQLTDYEYTFWLKSILEWTKENNTIDEQYVYINAWNEWAEGAILEPTTRYGYKNLQILKDCLESLKKE